MTPDLLQALLNNSHLLIMLPCFIWLFHRIEKIEERLDATIASGNARHDAMEARLDATIANTNARLDATWQELIALRKDVK